MMPSEKQIDRVDRVQRVAYVTDDGDGIGFHFNRGPAFYDIEAKRLDTAKKLVHWCAHLGEKNWFTGSLCREFIETVTTAGWYRDGDVWAINP